MAPKNSKKTTAKGSTRRSGRKASENKKNIGPAAAANKPNGHATRSSKGDSRTSSKKTAKDTTNADDSDSLADSLEDEDPDWELDATMEVLEQGGKEILNQLTYTNSMRAPFTHRNDEDIIETIRFTRGDRIWILPEKHSPNVTKGCDKVEDLPDQDWDVAEILNCCYLAKPADDSPGEATPVGFLEVVWLYSYKGLLPLEDVNLHSSWVERVKSYKLRKDERILTDHQDFVPLSSFAGFAEDIYAHLDLSGLYMSAEDRLSDPKDRKKRGKKDVLRIHGFGRRKNNMEVFATDEALKAAPDVPDVPQKAVKTKHHYKASVKKGRYVHGRHEAADEEEDELETPAPESNKRRKTKR